MIPQIALCLKCWEISSWPWELSDHEGDREKKQIHHVKYSSTVGVIEAEGESNFAPNGKNKD